MRDFLKSLTRNPLSLLGTAVVTARAWHPRGDSLTREWLHHHDLRVDELYLVPLFGNKAQVLNTLGVVEHFIDDHPAHLYQRRASARKDGRFTLTDVPWMAGVPASN